LNIRQIFTGKRFLFVFCSLNFGGAERQGLHLALYLKRCGANVQVLSTLAGHGPVADMCESTGIPWSTCRFLWPCRKSSLLRNGLRLLHVLRYIQPDVIIAYTHSPNVGCGLVWRWSKAKIFIWGQRNVWQVRGDSVERFAWRHASAVIGNAHHMLDYLGKKLGPTQAPIHIIHNGVKLPPALRTRFEWRAGLGIAEDATVATMVANFRSQKDHQTLLHSWKRIIDTCKPDEAIPHLLVAGAAQDTYDNVRKLASQLKLLGSINFLVPVADVTGLLAASDIGVLTSHHEGLSNSVIEYMAAGLPVVATDLPGNQEALGDDLYQPLVRCGDPVDLADKLLSLIKDPKCRRTIGERNRKRAESEFSVQAMCEQTVTIINDLLETTADSKGFIKKKPVNA
jgi:glycosyltransferase involved in cell wall biosynthesis